MKFKNLMLVLTFTVSIIFITVIGTTYAYYNISAGSVSGTTGTITSPFSVVFSDITKFDYNVGIPVSSSYQGMKIYYRVYIDIISIFDSSSDFILNVDLTDVEIDDELKVSDFKYLTSCKPAYDGHVGMTEHLEKGGTGLDFSGQSFSATKRLNAITISYDDVFDYLAILAAEEDGDGYRVECTTTVWLEESGQNQNALMGKHFSANIETNTVLKKR